MPLPVNDYEEWYTSGVDFRACLTACLVCGLWPGPGAGQAPAPRTQPELLLIEPLPEGAGARIRGQTADLAWTFTRVPGSAPFDPERLQRSALERGARCALWMEETDDVLRLWLFDTRARRVIERRFEFEAPRNQLARSAALEALALAVRAALRALSANEELVGAAPGVAGVGASADRSKPAAAAGTPPAAVTEREGSAADPLPPAPDSAHAAIAPDVSDSGSGQTALALAIGWDAALDGQSPTGQQGLIARVGVIFDRVELAVQVQGALAAELSHAQTELRLSRRLALASVGLDVLRTAPLELSVALSAGMAEFRRETRAVATGLRATPPQNSRSLAVGFEARAALSLFSTSALRFALELSAGALVLPAAPVLRYETGQAREDRALWGVQPHLHLAPHLSIFLL